ncbi:MAG: imidazole glycerol phosphate synthase subunit HisH [Oscillospiraceae bacterium]|nr:imidazole glycerol phosphate synthase subunit HisH [Oscillospiraceae bacterium]
MIAIIDYGAGNLFSVKNALDFLGVESVITSDAAQIEAADALILPGVGAFGDAMNRLESTGLVPVIKQQVQKKPLLGICLGMQMLFEKGFEFGEHDGLGLIPGKVRLLNANGFKIPHMGWNSLNITQENAVTKNLAQGDYVYFVHSYMADTLPQYICATSDYCEQVTALVANGNVYGAQFHPEKSGKVGLSILKNFCELAQKGENK